MKLIGIKYCGGCNPHIERAKLVCEIGKIVEKYFKGIASVPTENRCRVLRLIENITLGTAAVGYRTESMHGAGSPQAQRIMISRQGNLEQKKKLAKEIAGINETR
jgi:4-hydroxybutyryl-CoA dehydratase/vinylacetyl-CoA-Delta-isomerase